MRDRTLSRPDAAQRIREFHPRFRKAKDAEIFEAAFKLSDAQLTLAREHGFASWPALKARIENPSQAHRLDVPHHERITDPDFRRAVDLMDAGDVEGLKKHLREHPELVGRQVVFEGTNYFRNPTLLQFVAENPTRRGTLPKNIVEVARIILDHGVGQPVLDETLALAASSDVAQRTGVQIGLIDVLCDYGAETNHAALVAAMYGMFDAVEALIRRGARYSVALAAALGRPADVQRLLSSSSPEDRHWALALASQLGHSEIVRILLDAGEDPNRYNPLGGHSHSTPLHQAAGYGHLEMAKLLVERGARLDWKDTMWGATPAEWAHHEGRAEVEAYLRALEQEQRTER
jgi:hypothetical protein